MACGNRGAHSNLEGPMDSSSCSYRVISPVSVLDEYATVDHLIHWDTMTWKVDLLNEIFCPRDVELILKIPLSWRRPPDVLIWAGTKRGTFSVKSAYLLQCMNQNSQAALSSSSPSAQTLWSAI